MFEIVRYKPNVFSSNETVGVCDVIILTFRVIKGPKLMARIDCWSANATVLFFFLKEDFDFAKTGL